MTTPDPEQLFAILGEAVADGCEYAVMEVTSHALYFDKVAPITFDVSVFTNLSEDHLDFHRDMNSYFAAKSKLFSQSRQAVINYDDRYGRLLAEQINIPALLGTMEGRDTGCSAEVRPSIVSTASRTSFSMPAKSPAAIISGFTIQEPPQQRIFGLAR